MQTIYDGAIITLVKEDKYEIVHKKHEAVIIIALSDKNRVPMVTQYRPAIQTLTRELPAGFIDPEDYDFNNIPEDMEFNEAKEGILAAARREFLEETGLTLVAPEIVKSVYTSAGFTDERVHLVYGTFKEAPVTHELDVDHEIQSVQMYDADVYLNMGVSTATGTIAQYILRDKMRDLI